MKKGLLASYAAGIMDEIHGERYGTIFYYFFPEFVSALLLYSLPFWLDAWFVSQLSSTSAYATLGTTNNLIHFLIKLAEAFSVGTVIMAGQFNGMKEYDRVGHTVRDAFWVTCFTGLCFGAFLYLGAYPILQWYDVPADMAALGAPFLRLRAMSVVFMFMYFALVGFLRGIKNTRTPMYTFVFGTCVFILCDYLFIFGKWGFPEMGLQGSALASVLQYVAMFGAVLAAILYDPEHRKYGIDLFNGVGTFAYTRKLIMLSWPIMLDKATLAWAYIWLCKMINPMGTCVVASFCVLKDIERFAFVPAIGFAQVITFLVSNDYGRGNWDGIKSNIKKVCFLASIMVFLILVVFGLNLNQVIAFFDRKGDFTPLAAFAFPFVSVLVLFDLVQLLLSGALRGAGNVRIVMVVRLAICLGYFVPVSYMLSHADIGNQSLKFLLVYGSFYVGNALMSIAYIIRLRGEQWKKLAVKESL